MKTDFGTLVVVDMHGNFGARLQPFARGKFDAFDVRPNNVVGGADGQPLRELAGVIGIKLPAGFVGLVSVPPDLHFDPIEWVPVGVPNGSEDESVRLRLLAAAAASARWGQQRHQEHGRQSHGGQAAEHPEMCGVVQESSSSSSSSSASSSSSSSSSISSSPTTFNSTGFTVTTSKSVPHSGQETTAPSSTSSSSMSRSVSHSGQYTMISSTLGVPCYI